MVHANDLHDPASQPILGKSNASPPILRTKNPIRPDLQRFKLQTCQLFSQSVGFHVMMLRTRPWIFGPRTRLRRKAPSSARERAMFSPGKDDDLSTVALAKAGAGDIGFIVDGVGCSQVEKGPLVFDPEAQTRGEARSSFPTQPSIRAGFGAIFRFK